MGFYSAPGSWSWRTFPVAYLLTLMDFGDLVFRRYRYAALFRRLATLREDVPLKEKLGDLEWRGAQKRLKSLCRELGVEDLPKRISAWRS